MYFCPLRELCHSAFVGMCQRTSMERRSGEHPERNVVSGVCGGATRHARTDGENRAVSWRSVSVRVLPQYRDEIGMAVLRGSPMVGHPASGEEGTLVSVLCASVASDVGCLAGDGVTPRWPMSFGGLYQFVASPPMEVRRGPRVARQTALDSRGTLVPVLCAEPEAETRRNATDCTRTRRAVPVDELQKRGHAFVVGMPVRTCVESACGAGKKRPPKEGELVPGMLQLAATISWETQSSCDAGSGDFERWRVPIGRIPRQQGQVALGVHVGASLAGGALVRDPGHLVSGMRPQPAAWFATFSGACGKQRRNVFVRDICQ